MAGRGEGGGGGAPRVCALLTKRLRASPQMRPDFAARERGKDVATEGLPGKEATTMRARACTPASAQAALRARAFRTPRCTRSLGAERARSLASQLLTGRNASRCCESIFAGAGEPRPCSEGTRLFPPRPRAAHRRVSVF